MLFPPLSLVGPRFQYRSGRRPTFSSSRLLASTLGPPLSVHHFQPSTFSPPFSVIHFQSTTFSPPFSVLQFQSSISSQPLSVLGFQFIHLQPSTFAYGTKLLALQTKLILAQKRSWPNCPGPCWRRKFAYGLTLLALHTKLILAQKRCGRIALGHAGGGVNSPTVSHFWLSILSSF